MNAEAKILCIYLLSEQLLQIVTMEHTSLEVIYFDISFSLIISSLLSKRHKVAILYMSYITAVFSAFLYF